MKQEKIPGVLGGMGPEATIDFMSRLLRMNPAATDQDHLRLLIDHNPQVPNRHAAITGKDSSAGPCKRFATACSSLASYYIIAGLKS